MTTKTFFTCQNCGAQSPKWQGRCQDCNSWNTFVEEEMVSSPRQKAGNLPAVMQAPVLLKNVEIKDSARLKTGITELDRVLGGGVVGGSLVLIGGDPGIGKSTLSLEMAANLSKHVPVLYVSGEESARQVKMRSERLSVSLGDNFYIVNITDLEGILKAIEKSKAQIVIIDSIQVIYTELIASSPGSVAQVRECANILMQAAKSKSVSMFIIGHVTKEGAIAGPRVLEHIVDTVLYFEGEKFSNYRILRAVKNRFGSTNEIGVFEMTAKGLVGVVDPSKYFICERNDNASGDVICATMEGTRPILVELQALVTKAGFGSPRRTAQGLDYNRLNLLIAVLEKRIGLKLDDKDVFVNVVGGINVDDPALDLALTTAIASGVYDKVIDRDLVVLGEVGLGGEIRSVTNLSLRLKEVQKLGFKKAIVPLSNKQNEKEVEGLEIIAFSSLKEMFKFIWR